MIFLKLVNSIDKILQKLLIALMALLLIDVSWQVMTRFLLENPSSFTEELARFLLIWIGLLGSAHAYRHKMHLGVDVLVNALSDNVSKRIAQLVQLVTIAFALSVLVYGGITLMMLAVHLNQTSPSMQVNMGIVYFALPLSGALFTLFAIERLVTGNHKVEYEPDEPSSDEMQKGES